MLTALGTIGTVVADIGTTGMAAGTGTTGIAPGALAWPLGWQLLPSPQQLWLALQAALELCIGMPLAHTAFAPVITEADTDTAKR